MLKFEVEAVPEGLDQFYTKDETSGKFRLAVEGVVPETEVKGLKEKVNTFRNDNITLKRQLEELGDFEAVVGADGKVTKDGVKNTIEGLVQNRTSKMKQDYEVALAEREKQMVSMSARLEEVLIADAVKAAALSHAVVPTGVDDVLARARRAFKVVEGKVVSTTNSGDGQGNPLTIETFVTALKSEAPHLFVKSEGTGQFNRSRQQNDATNQPSRATRLAGFAK